MTRDLVVAALNIVLQILKVLPVEGPFADQHLVDDDAEAPDVDFVIVLALAHDLRSHVVRRADLGLVELALHVLGEAHVANLDNVVLDLGRV